MIPLLLPESRYPDARARLAFYDQLLPHVDAIPGVIAASPLHVGPGTGTAGLSARMMFEGQAPDEADRNPWASWEPVTPSYFRTLGIPIVRGRGFADPDGRDGAPVAIVSEAVARRYWPGQDPLGKRRGAPPQSDPGRYWCRRGACRIVAAHPFLALAAL